MKHALLSCLAFGLAIACPAATLTVSNATSAGNGFHGIANEAGALLSPGQARGVLGRMTLSDNAIADLVAAGDLTALNAAFQPFGSDFDLALSESGPAGAFEKSITADSRVSANNFGGSPVYLWIHLGADRGTANQYLLAKLHTAFPTDAEEAPPAFASLALRPDNIDQLHAGSLAGSHDYGLGGGATTTLRLQPPDGSPNRLPVVENLAIQVLAGVAFNGQVTATDADLDPLEFIQVSDPTKGVLFFDDDGSFTYTAGAEQSGQDSFTFKANDGKTDSAIATVTIQIQNGGKLAQTLTFTPPMQIDSDAAPLLLTATASSGLPVSFELLGGPATLDGASLTLTGEPGTLQVRASQPGNASYTPVSTDRLIHVVPANAAFAIGNLNQVYLGIPLHVSITGAPLEEVTLTYNGEANPPVNAGTYAVVALRGATRKTAKLVIAKAPLTVTADDQSRLIGQPNPELSFSYAGFVGGDSTETVFPAPATKTAAPPIVSTTAKETSPAGSYPIRFSGGAAANYQFVFVPGTLTIEGFEGRYEILLTHAEFDYVTAKVELITGKTVKNGLLPFSGKLWVPTEIAPLPLKGGLEIDAETERASVSLPFSRGGNTYELELDLDLDGGLQAELSQGGAPHSAALDGRKLHSFGKTETPPSLGTHTLVFAPGTRVAGGDLDLPAGAGHATGLFSKTGQLKLVGRLADGTTLTATLLPDAGGRYRLYANPYKRLNSFVAAALPVTPHPDLDGLGHIAESAGHSFFWTKAGADKDKSYRAGIDLLGCDLRLDPWRKPAKAGNNGQEITLLGELGLDAENSIGVAHSDLPGIAAADLPASVRIASNGKFSVLDPIDNPAGWQISLTTANGSFKGKFTLRDGKTRTVNFTGVLTRTLSTDPTALLGRGHFLLPPAPGADSTELQSGEIQFFLD
jgi:VCBS repeat-containing protein